MVIPIGTPVSVLVLKDYDLHGKVLSSDVCPFQLPMPACILDYHHFLQVSAIILHNPLPWLFVSHNELLDSGGQGLATKWTYQFKLLCWTTILTSMANKFVLR